MQSSNIIVVRTHMILDFADGSLSAECCHLYLISKNISVNVARNLMITICSISIIINLSESELYGN